MAECSAYMRSVLAQLRAIREERGLSAQDVESKLILGPGWLEHFEFARALPSLDTLAAILSALGSDLPDLASRVGRSPVAERVDRLICAKQQGRDLLIRFRYGAHQATYTLRHATEAQFDAVMRTLRNGLAGLADATEQQGQAVKAAAVANSFLEAVRHWPYVNPSDIWYFVIYRAYCDPYNHPARHSGLNLEQSWKRTGGWALERVLVRHYAPGLAARGIRLFIPSMDEKTQLLAASSVKDRLEPDKVDVLLTGRGRRQEELFGVVHVKASFAERRTDDVPLSRALIGAGYTSPLWTMDCKAPPSEHPVNRGELGAVLIPGERDRRSAKRKDIEDDGYFSACFSYNANTQPTPRRQHARAKVEVCDFTRPDGDAFFRFTLRQWRQFQRAKRGSS